MGNVGSTCVKMANSTNSTSLQLEIADNASNSKEIEDLMDAEVADDGNDTTDEESSVYSGLEDDEDDSFDEEGGDDVDNEDDDEDDEDDEDDDSEEEDEGDSSAEEMSTNEDENLDKASLPANGKAAVAPIESESVGTSVALLKPIENEYEHDSSDEEDLRNTVGNIPMNWYNDYPHLGYDLEGKPIMKPKRGDEIDNFLRKMENPESWRTVYDPQTGQDVVLSNEDVDLIKNVMSSKIPDGSYNPYQPWIDWFTSEVRETPVTSAPEHKRSFVPSRIEAIKVGRMVHAIKMGWMKPREPKEKREDRQKYYLMWDDDGKSADVRRIENPISAPKPRLPGHVESYNPPPEYTFSEKDIAHHMRLIDTPYKRKFPFIPQQFSSLRSVPAYDRFAPSALCAVWIFTCVRAPRRCV